MPIPEVKKSELTKDSENIFAYWKNIRAKRGVFKQVRFVPNTVGGSRREHSHSKQNLLYNK